MMITEFMWHRWLLSLSRNEWNKCGFLLYYTRGRNIYSPSIALPFVTLILLSLFVSWAKGDSILLYYIDDDKRFFTCCCFFYSTHCALLRHSALAVWVCVYYLDSFITFACVDIKISLAFIARVDIKLCVISFKVDGDDAILLTALCTELNLRSS